MNSISVSIAERKREIGVLRALGATRVSMVILFVTEVIGIGFVGSALGCGLGKVLAHLLSNQVAASVGIQFQAQIFITKLELSFGQILFTVSCGTLASVAAAFIPALRAAAIHPLESMKKHSENFTPEDQKRSDLAVWAGLGLLIFNSVCVVYGLGQNLDWD